MKKITLIITIITIAFGLISVPSFASVKGITADNYTSYEKPIHDSYGYNKGECNRPYVIGEEYFYNEYYDHWNVDKIYDKDVLIKNKIIKTSIKSTTKTKKYNNLFVAKKWTKEHYKKYKIKVVNYNKVPKHRKSNKVIYIEKCPTIAKGGKNGQITIDNSYVKYSKKVKKGTKQVCYCIWNPKNNVCDDVVAFVNCNKIK